MLPEQVLTMAMPLRSNSQQLSNQMELLALQASRLQKLVVMQQTEINKKKIRSKTSIPIF